VRLAQSCNLPLTAISVTSSDGEDAQRRDAQAALERVEAAAREAGLQIESRMEEGRRPDEVILEVAKSCEADLIVLGSHGRTGLSRLLMGSVSERVLGNAQCPVLVVKATV
jgi:nucleotide-binding universal stress UspA family protein